jgi:hypothetical protein
MPILRNHRTTIWAAVLIALFCADKAACGPAKPRKAKSEKPKVVSAYTERDGQTFKGGTLNDQLVVEMAGLKEWLQTPDHKKVDHKSIILFLRNTGIPDAHPTQLDPEHNRLVFGLRRTPESREAWTAILSPITGRRTIPVSVAFKDEPPLDTNARDFELIIIPNDWVLWVCGALFLLFLVTFAWLALWSNILRDSGKEPNQTTEESSTPGFWRRVTQNRKPFSLAWSQMAFWFVMVLAAYLIIWIATRDRDVLPAEILALLGISASTALGAAMIDVGKRSGAQADLEVNRKRQATLEQEIQDLNSKTLVDDAKLARDNQVKEKEKELSLVKAKVTGLEADLKTGPSKGFFKDVLSDTEGTSLHRFQVFVWTIVLGIVFVSAVVNQLSMPTFSATLLALMGISGATYVGFKFPEAGKS